MSVRDITKLSGYPPSNVKTRLEQSNYYLASGSNLDKAAISNKLKQRNVKHVLNEPLKDLKSKLANEIHGIQRLPALMYNNPSSSLTKNYLRKYEILCNEPLHDISNHIKNLYKELPWHVQNKRAMIQNSKL